MNELDAINFVKERYKNKFGSLDDFDEYYQKYQEIPIFKANQNYYQKNLKSNISSDTENNFVSEPEDLNCKTHWIMRMFTQFYLTKAFECMKVDLVDDNIAESALGKGTPGRIAKMWVGDSPEDTSELGSGRWNKQPYISIFPNEDNNKQIITKEVDLTSCCSHHFLPFSSLISGKATISYIPGNFIIGISKLQRFVNWCARRFWLQEDLTRYIGTELKRIAETEDVYVRLENIVHGCEKFRGVNSSQGNLTTEFRSGVFLNDK